MKKKLLFRLLVILFATSAWSCADSSFDVDEEEELLFADLYVDNDKLELGDLLLPGYPVMFGYAVSRIFLEKTMGSKLLNLIKEMIPILDFWETLLCLHQEWITEAWGRYFILLIC